MPTYLTDCEECRDNELDEIIKKAKPDYVNHSFHYNLELVDSLFSITFKTTNNSEIRLPVEICKKIVRHANNMFLVSCINKNRFNSSCSAKLCPYHYKRAKSNGGRCDRCCWWDA